MISRNFMGFRATRSRHLAARLAQTLNSALLLCFVSHSVVLAAPLEAQLRVTVVDAQGSAMEHAVVSLHDGKASPAEAQKVAIMDQRDLQFAPGVLGIRTGTVVEFPNQDDVRHHVYSFSHPNAFELKLYHGQTGNYQQFDHPGVVVLGCNIHDGMLGYLRVVDTPWFATSDQTGSLTIDAVARGGYEMQIWHPDLGMKLMRQRVELDSGTNSLRVTLDNTVKAVPEKKPVHSLQSLFRD